MAILTHDEFMERMKTIIGENTDDDSIKNLEDFTDTLNDFETKTKDSTDWKNKYTELDNEWKKKYKERFFSGGEPNGNDGGNDGGEPNGNDGGNEGNETEITIDDLFTE